MKCRFIKETIVYTGEQLRSNFAYSQFGVIGDSIISFCGKCDVKLREMVDIEDLRSGKVIYSDMMLHFIIEHYNTDLEKAILKQLLFANILKDSINDHIGNNVIIRDGDDLYDNEAKLSISVATVTPISSLIHFGMNITSTNTPVKTKGLKDYNITPHIFANSVMEKYAKEQDKIYIARCKVKWIE